MTDYYPLIGRAVAGLEKNTGDQRRALYERARTALVAQLRGLDPPLTESEITRERLALEEAIRKVEAEAARKARLELPRIDPVAKIRPSDLLRRDGAPPPLIPQPPRTGSPAPAAPPVREAPVTRDRPSAREAPPPREPPSAPAPTAREPSPNREPPPRPPASVPAEPRRKFAFDVAPDAVEPRHAEAAFPPVAPTSAPSRNRGRERPPPLTDGGLKGFRDVVAEAETLGEATAQAARAAREAYAAVPADDPELDRMEPRLEPMGLRTPLREPRGPEPSARAPEEWAPARPVDSPPLAEPPRTAPLRPVSVRHGVAQPEPPQRSAAAMLAALLAVLVIVSIAAALYWWREPIRGFFAAVRLPLQAHTEQNPTRPKIPDRVGEPGQAAPAPSAALAGKETPVAAVAQHVVLYEEDPAEPQQSKRFVGSAVWRTDTISPGPGQAPELAIRAEFDIPERGMSASMSIRRNTDQALPASHTIELTFNVPADFPFGGINNVAGMLMKQAEQARGAQLAGLAVKVTPTFYLIGLSSAEGEVQRNIQLLKERPWFDIPVTYTNGRRAILAVEKGTPGDRAFAEAFAAWGE
jgi:hypothetical protein